MRKKLKLEIVAAELKNHDVAVQANAYLPEYDRLTEHAITRFITERSTPTQPQAEAIAQVLGCRWDKLFDGVRS